MGYLGQKYDKGIVIQRSEEGSAFQEDVNVTVDGETELTPKVGGGFKKVTVAGAGGTEVIANPELEGNEEHLSSLEIDGTVYDLDGKIYEQDDIYSESRIGYVANNALAGLHSSTEYSDDYHGSIVTTEITAGAGYVDTTTTAQLAASEEEGGDIYAKAQISIKAETDMETGDSHSEINIKGDDELGATINIGGELDQVNINGQPYSNFDVLDKNIIFELIPETIKQNPDDNALLDFFHTRFDEAEGWENLITKSYETQQPVTISLPKDYRLSVIASNNNIITICNNQNFEDDLGEYPGYFTNNGSSYDYTPYNYSQDRKYGLMALRATNETSAQVAFFLSSEAQNPFMMFAVRIETDTEDPQLIFEDAGIDPSAGIKKLIMWLPSTNNHWKPENADDSTLEFDTIADLYSYLTSNNVDYCPIMISDIGAIGRFTKLGVLNSSTSQVIGIEDITDILTYFGNEARIHQKTFNTKSHLCIVVGETIEF